VGEIQGIPPGAILATASSSKPGLFQQ
jgi:hypothetical protein